MESQDKKKKFYFPPTLTELTPEQGKKFVAERENCSEEEAAEFLSPSDSSRRTMSRIHNRNAQHNAESAATHRSGRRRRSEMRVSDCAANAAPHLSDYMRAIASAVPQRRH
jgi:hypothetical protein